MWFLSSGVVTLVQLGWEWEERKGAEVEMGGFRARRGYGRSGWRHGGRSRWWLDRRLVQVLEADALDVASIGRAVTAGAEVW